MSFWKDRAALRVALMLVFFAAGLALLLVGWRLTGKLLGLILMLAGVVFLLTTLLLYNKPFETPKIKRGEGRRR